MNDKTRNPTKQQWQRLIDLTKSGKIEVVEHHKHGCYFDEDCLDEIAKVLGLPNTAESCYNEPLEWLNTHSEIWQNQNGYWLAFFGVAFANPALPNGAKNKADIITHLELVRDCWNHTDSSKQPSPAQMKNQLGFKKALIRYNIRVLPFYQFSDVEAFIEHFCKKSCRSSVESQYRLRISSRFSLDGKPHYMTLAAHLQKALIADGRLREWHK